MERDASLNSPAAPPSAGAPQPPPVPLRWLHEPGPWIIALAGVTLWLAGYPMPHADDLFFTGVSIEVARSGNLVNPWLSTWMASLGTDQFYVFPPTLPYAQALWVRCFGVSTGSFTSFHLLIQAALELCIYLLARKGGLGRLSALGAAAVAGFFPVVYGIRPDALAMLLVVLGQLACHGPRPWHWVLGALLSSGAVLSHPIAMAFVIPCHAGQLIGAWPHKDRFRQLLVATALGVAVAFACFLVAIHGHLAEFLRVMSAHRALVMSSEWYLGPVDFYSELVTGKEFWLRGPIALLVLAGFGRLFFAAVPDERTKILRRFAWMWLAAVGLGAFCYATRVVHYAAYSGLVLAILIWARTRWSGAITAAAVAAVMLHNAGAILTPIFGNLARPDAAVIREAIRQNPGKTPCMDEVVARYVFDFRLPEGASDWGLREPEYTGNPGTLATKPPHTLWLVSEWRLEHNVPDSGVTAERLRVGPFVLGSQARNPYRVKIVE
jgi:hypothetical protein